MQQLSELDASFLFLETEQTPLHVGGVFVFRKSSSKSSFNFNRFRSLMESRLGNERFFRSRVMTTPLNLELPVWADDPNFDLDKHVSYNSLSASHNPDSLSKLAATIFSTPLDRSAPLWSATYIDNLENDPNYQDHDFALVLKIHLAAVDASSGEDVLSQLLQISPDIHDLAPVAAWTPAPLPDSSSWLDIAYTNALTIPSKLALLAKDTAASMFYGMLQERLSGLKFPASLMKIPATSINQHLSSQRTIDNISIPVSQIRTIRQNLVDVTTNDVLMGICAEALANYIKENDSKPVTAPLIALSPIAVRSTSLDIKSGNQLSASLFSLATTEQDPIERIRQIHQAAQSSNYYDDAISASRLTELMPSCMAALSTRVYSEFLLGQKHSPLFNLPISNIPGPQFPLYLEDNELTHFMSAGPLFDGIGLGIMIVSYNESYSITATYCPELMQSEKPFSSYLNAALERISGAKDQPISSHTEQVTDKGIIEDVVGLVSGLFTFGEKANK